MHSQAYVAINRTKVEYFCETTKQSSKKDYLEDTFFTHRDLIVSFFASSRSLSKHLKRLFIYNIDVFK